MKNAAAWWRELYFEGQQRHHAKGPWFFGCHSSEAFPLLHSERNYFYTPVPNGSNRELNRARGFPAVVMFSYREDYLRMSVSNVRDHLDRMAKVGIKLKILSALLLTEHHAVVHCLATDNMTRICGNYGVLTRRYRGIVRRWFAMGTFCVWRRMHCSPILSPLAIVWSEKVDCDSIGVEWFPFEYEVSKFIFIPPVPGVACNRADRKGITEGGHDEFHPVYRKEFADRSRSRDFAERA